MGCILVKHRAFLFKRYWAPCTCCMCFFVIRKRQNAHFKYFSLLRMSHWITAGFLFKFHMPPPVSGNILAPLHRFYSHDREYALKVNNHICEELNMLKGDHNSRRHDDDETCPPLRWHGVTHAAVCLSAEDTCHHLTCCHRPSDTFCFTFGGSRF